MDYNFYKQFTMDFFERTEEISGIHIFFPQTKSVIVGNSTDFNESDFIEALKNYCLVYNINDFCVVLEAWMDLSIHPTEPPIHMEVLICSIVNKFKSITIWSPIIKEENEKRKLGEWNIQEETDTVWQSVFYNPIVN